MHRSLTLSLLHRERALAPFRRLEPRLKDTLQAETSDVGLDEVEVLVSVVVLLLQRADGVALGGDGRKSRKHWEGGFILDRGIVEHQKQRGRALVSVYTLVHTTTTGIPRLCVSVLSPNGSSMLSSSSLRLCGVPSSPLPGSTYSWNCFTTAHLHKTY